MNRDRILTFAKKILTFRHFVDSYSYVILASHTDVEIFLNIDICTFMVHTV